MRQFLKIVVVLLVLGGTGVALYRPAMEYWKHRSRPKFRTAKVDQGDLAYEVNATGSVKPTITIKVGAFVSGPVEKIYVDHNSVVEKDQLLAEIDARLYDSAVARDRANHATRTAEVARVNADLQRAKNDEARAEKVRKENPDFIADTEWDQIRFNRQSLEAQLAVAETGVLQAQASLDTSLANLTYTKIKSPVAGIVIERKIDEGQTLAAQFQTPEMFVVAPDMDKKIHVYASVDEADIGLIRQAQLENKPVNFTVDAYPSDLFEGKTEQVRMASSTTQNVVTYPVVVSAPNPNMKLLPGMTASLSFQIEKKLGVLRVPNAALRFYPEPQWVRTDDRGLLELTETSREGPDEQQELQRSASENSASNRQRNRRHVWVSDGDALRAVQITTGISDNRFTELVAGELKEGDELVTSIDRRGF